MALSQGEKLLLRADWLILVSVKVANEHIC